ncbi:MAG: alpha-2-macroglobulin family protein, partial [Chlorobi bacterium]|nr:alpha-2-macroglobulin family protein [Chlorobiota bacterium]
WSSGAAASFETDKEGRVEIVTDKKSYEPGEKAKILFTCPFAGKLLVTTERMGTFDYRYIDIDKSRSAEIELEIKDEFMPNVYISATLFKKHSVNRNVPFLVGHGYASIKVEKKSNILPLKIKAPDKIKPNRKVNITLTSLPEKNINVTLAVVDEGILQIKDFPTPDPYEYMYAKRALGVSSYDIYKMLLPEIRSASSAPGGGYGKMKSELKKRTNPFAGKRFKLFAFWSGILKTDSKGKVTVPVTVPQFNGEVRIMAVAVSGTRFGSADKYMKVADDIILAPQIPRFMTKGDSLIMPVTAMNTTSKSKKIKISLSVEGPLKVSSKKSRTITIGANGSAKTTFAIKAENIGDGVINIKTSGAAKVKEKIDIGIRPNSPLISETGAGSIKSGKSKTLEIPGGFIEKTQHTNLTISRFPAIKFAKHLKYLVGYPHGCIEQTVSKLFPQLYFGDLAKA